MARFTTFDWNALSEKLDGDAEIVTGLLGIALRSSAALPGELRAACSARDYPSLVRLAHKLKGTAGDLVAEPLRVAARDAELAARAAAPRAFELGEALARTLDALVVELRMAVNEVAS